jgi:hypothetical protein
MAQTSDELRAEIEHTRDDMSETVEALAYKADVPSRTKEWLGDKKDAIVSKVGAAPAKVGDLAPDGRELGDRMTGLRRTAERNPLGLAIAGAAAGFLAGLAAPSTRVEDERIGPVADDLKAAAAETGREAVQRGKAVAEETSAQALETAKDTGRQQGEELAAGLQERAREAAPHEDDARDPSV